MRIKIITIGKPKGNFAEIFDEYTKRMSSFAKVETFHVKEGDSSEQKAIELMGKTFKIVMSEEGRSFSSKKLAEFLEKREVSGQGDLSFFIGGPDGHSKDVKDQADLLMSLSELTLPHDMAMTFLAETIYRSLSILNNHPYHRQ